LAARPETAAVFNLQCAGFRLDCVKRDGKCRVRDALSRIRQTQRLTRFRGYIASASAETQTNVAGAVESYDGMIDAVKFVRDTSFDVAGIGGTIMTGGAAARGIAHLSGQEPSDGDTFISCT
jgi:hypothetical protein